MNPLGLLERALINRLNKLVVDEESGREIDLLAETKRHRSSCDSNQIQIRPTSGIGTLTCQ